MPVSRDIFGRGRLLIQTEKAELQNNKGLQHLDLDKEKNALLYVPKNYTVSTPSPLAVMLHGAGGNADHGMHLLQHLADEAGMIILSPASESNSWDVINYNRFGVDVIFINQLITRVFEQFIIDKKRLAIGGFSDGASYALSLGLINGDIFTHIIAFSPGFYYSPDLNGVPSIYISHGIYDDILPIEPCSRRIVPKLKKSGYPVLYREFDGPHIIPPYISLEATQWFIGKQG